MSILNTGTKLAVLVVILLILALFGYALFGHKETEKVSPLVGNRAPDFSLNLMDGKKISSSELRGKTVLLNFWASWCMPCREEAQALEESWQKYKDKNVVFIGVNIWDENSSAASYIETFGGGGYPQGTDPKEEIQVDYGIGGVPETFFISPTGIITDKYNGALTEDAIDYYIQQAMIRGTEKSSIK
ncbi:MAG: TlpA family protein disulfide reductase [Thermodesulfobacteriota bacterium]